MVAKGVQRKEERRLAVRTCSRAQKHNLGATLQYTHTSLRLVLFLDFFLQVIVAMVRYIREACLTGGMLGICVSNQTVLRKRNNQQRYLLLVLLRPSLVRGEAPETQNWRA